MRAVSAQVVGLAVDPGAESDQRVVAGKRSFRVKSPSNCLNRQCGTGGRRADGQRQDVVSVAGALREAAIVILFLRHLHAMAMGAAATSLHAAASTDVLALVAVVAVGSLVRSPRCFRTHTRADSRHHQGDRQPPGDYFSENPMRGVHINYNVRKSPLD